MLQAIQLTSGRRAMGLLVRPAGVICGAVILCALGARGAETLYSVTNLGILPGADSSKAASINDRGQVTGQSGGRVFLWDAKTGLQDLGSDGFASITAVAINNIGQIAGNAMVYDPPNYPLRGLRWTAGQWEILGFLGNFYRNTMVSAIDDMGRIAGASDAPTAMHAFRSAPTGAELVDLGSLNGNDDDSGAGGINASGQVVGSSNVAGRQRHAFLWTEGGTDGPPSNPQMRDLGTLGGTQSQANGTSDSGIVVGGSSTAGDAAYHAFVWERGEMTDLGTLGHISSRAFAVNNEGQVIGSIWGADGNAHAIIWDRKYGMRQLNELLHPVSGRGWSIAVVSDINNAGQIVGEGEYQGQSRAILLTPIPEPAWEWMMVPMGVVACRALRARWGNVSSKQ